jgi:DNA-binding CsgD family transcriptional regulator
VDAVEGHGRSCAFLIGRDADGLLHRLGTSKVRWQALTETGGPFPVEHCPCGVAVATHDPEEIASFAEVWQHFARVPVVMIASRSLDPYQYFRTLELAVDVVELTSDDEWVTRVEGLFSGERSGVAALRSFCARHRLSPRESLTLLAACAGLTKTEAHEELGCSVRTLDTYWSRIFGKVGVRSVDGVLAAALRSTLSAPGNGAASTPFRQLALPGRGPQLAGR